MNNTIGMNRNIKRQAVKAKRTPAWLIIAAQFILWLTKDETVKSLRAGTALAIIGLIAAFAAGMSTGNVPLVYGVIISSALAAIALMLTRDLD